MDIVSLVLQELQKQNINEMNFKFIRPQDFDVLFTSTEICSSFTHYLLKPQSGTSNDIVCALLFDCFQSLSGISSVQLFALQYVPILIYVSLDKFRKRQTRGGVIAVLIACWKIWKDLQKIENEPKKQKKSSTSLNNIYIKINLKNDNEDIPTDENQIYTDCLSYFSSEIQSIPITSIEQLCIVIGKLCTLDGKTGEFDKQLSNLEDSMQLEWNVDYKTIPPSLYDYRDTIDYIYNLENTNRSSSNSLSLDNTSNTSNNVSKNQQSESTNKHLSPRSLSLTTSSAFSYPNLKNGILQRITSKKPQQQVPTFSPLSTPTSSSSPYNSNSISTDTYTINTSSSIHVNMAEQSPGPFLNFSPNISLRFNLSPILMKKFIDILYNTHKICPNLSSRALNQAYYRSVDELWFENILLSSIKIEELLTINNSGSNLIDKH